MRGCKIETVWGKAKELRVSNAGKMNGNTASRQKNRGNESRREEQKVQKEDEKKDGKGTPCSALLQIERRSRRQWQ